ncbi:MAG: dihydrofolate reductase [Flavobacteriaceae bacterium]|nr:dihydrofolate reductase [Flavobacteriaceae bacterium]
MFKIYKSILFLFLSLTLLSSCKKETTTPDLASTDNFNYNAEQFADVQVLRYQIPDFDKLSVKQKELVYYLTQAGLAGRDIMYDQNYRHNLKIRRTFEHIYTNYQGDKTTEDWKSFVLFLKRIWFSNGIHHHYSNDKFMPEFSKGYLESLLNDTNTSLSAEILEVLFSDKDAKKVNLDPTKDLVLGSAVNFYGSDITEKDVDNYYSKIIDRNDPRPIEYGLNSKLVKENGVLKEKVWKVGGMYSAAIEQIVFWLEKAKSVAENNAQGAALGLLIEYYKTGDLKTWDAYNIAWAKATEGDIDYISGFVEVYNDPKGFRGSYETVVQIKDFDMSAKMAVLAENAQWFEDNSTLIESHKKKNVVGVSYKTVNVAGEAGDSSPTTPIGVNLPNNNWIRQEHGSKSVSLGNIIHAYNNAGGGEKIKEFAFSKEEIELEETYGQLADKLHTSLHEVIGHASGQINKGIGMPKETLKNYASTLEEARADLVGLYYLSDKKLEEFKLTDNAEKLGKAAYNDYIRNGLMTQLIRIKLSDDIEESHMRNRQLVAAWAFEKGAAEKVIEKISKNGKTYFVINDYVKLRKLFGDLLREIQRIKSEGDYESGKYLVEKYGVKVDHQIHKEVLERSKHFKSAPYNGFINPVLTTVTDKNGKITDVKVEYPTNFTEQMLFYAKTYTTLPDEN